MTFSFASSGCDDGSFDGDPVIQSVTILGMERKPSAVTVCVSGKDLTHVGQNMVTSGEDRSHGGVHKGGNSEEFSFPSGATDQTVGFEHVEMCSAVTVNGLNLRASLDWQIQIL